MMLLKWFKAVINWSDFMPALRGLRNKWWESTPCTEPVLPAALTKPSALLCLITPTPPLSPEHLMLVWSTQPSPGRQELRQGRGSLGIRSPSFFASQLQFLLQHCVGSRGACLCGGPARGSLPVLMHGEHWLNSKSKQQLSPPPSLPPTSQSLRLRILSKSLRAPPQPTASPLLPPDFFCH